MGSTEQERQQYAMFEEKVRRTVFLDNLSPQVTEPVIRMALDQFGLVLNIQFIQNYTEPGIPQSALVEVENPQKAQSIISLFSTSPFMMSGMPRPVRARPAVAEMFDDRPKRPGRRIRMRWLAKEDPDFEVAKELKKETKKHAAEAAFLLKQQLLEEEKLAMQQQSNLKATCKKYDMINGVIADRTASKLATQFGLKTRDRVTEL